MRRANGSGSIVKLSGTRRRPYQAKAPGTYDPVTGIYSQKTIGTYKTRLEAEEALIAYIKNPISLEGITIKQLYTRWSSWHFDNIAERSKKSYKNMFTYLKPIENVKLKNLNLFILQDLLNSYKDKSQSTIKRIRSMMSMLCKEALRLEYIPTNYAELLVTPKGTAPKEKKIFTDIEVQKMWSSLGKVKNIEIPIILIYTGMRIGELATCKIEYINLEEHFIVHGSKTESGKNRIIPIPNRLLPLIKQLCTENQTYLIEKSPGVAYRDVYLGQTIYYKALEQAGVNKLTSHACRRTYATMINTSVLNKQYITRILGHTDFDTTDKYYIINRAKDLVDAVSNL